MKRVARYAAGVAALSLILAGCSSTSGSESTSSAAATSTASSAEASAPAAASSAAAATGADTEAAKAFLAEYEQAPASFPITTALSGSVKGKTAAYLDCGTPICGYTWTDIEAAAKQLGLNVTRINAGLQAESINTAFDTVMQTKPDLVFNPALPNPLAEAGLKQLKEAGIPVSAGGVVNGDPELNQSRLASEIANARIGEIAAAYVVEQQGDQAKPVFYVTPELELTTVMYEAFKAKMAELCPTCEVRESDIPVATLGTTAATKVTDDLQANPDTSMAVFAVGEQAIGLKAALDAAALDIPNVVIAPNADTFQQMKDGAIDAGIGFDFIYLDWAMVDAGARLINGEPLDQSEIDDVIPFQILKPEDVTDTMVKYGWTAFPDIAGNFKTLWPAS